MTKFSAFVLLVVILAAPSTQVLGDQPDPAEQEYKFSVAKAQKDFDQRVQAATAQYIEKLKVEMQAATKNGDLDRAIKIREKIASMESLMKVETAKRGGVIDLLSLVDISRDSVSGTWVIKNGSLVSDLGQYSRIQFPYHPPEEYDFEIEFVRDKGNNDVAQILTKSNNHFAWIIGGYGNTVFGFSELDGKLSGDNMTTVRAKECLENGRIYKSLVKVRHDSVQSFLDGKLVSEWKPGFGDLSLRSEEKLADPMALGLWTYGSEVKFRKITIEEISGKGEIVERK